MGNYLRAEVLFDAGLHPTLRPRDLDEAQTTHLAEALLSIPRLSFATRGIEPTRGMRADYLAREGQAFRFRVFQRDGQPCERCGTPLERIASQSRPLFLCPRCQPGRPPK